jgi:hypothetical protein
MAAVAMAADGARGDGEWVPAGQDVPAALAKTPKATAEDLGEPVQSAVFFPGNINRAPNPDGKTYDVVIPYEQQYGGPASVAIIALSPNQFVNGRC